MFVSNPAIQSVPVEDIRAPVLIVAAKDDPLALFENSRRLARRIPGAELYAVADGGHVLLGHTYEIESRISDFLAEAMGAEPSRQVPRAASHAGSNEH